MKNFLLDLDDRYRFYKQTSVDGHSDLWVMETDERKCAAVMELPRKSKWHKDRNPDWADEYASDVAEIQARADLMQSAPIMLRALLAAKEGDLSLIDEAIQHATGKVDWLGAPK